MKKIFLILLISTLAVQAFPQYLVNQGAVYVADGSLNIQGDYQNETGGQVSFASSGSPKVIVTGNWTNNASTSIMPAAGTNGEVQFAGSTAQTIGGTSTATFDFEKLTVNSGATVNVTPAKGVTTNGAATFTGSFVLKSSTNVPYRPQTATFINNSTVTGNIKAELYLESPGASGSTTGRSWYITTPITNATTTLFNLAGGTNLPWINDYAAASWVKISTNGVALIPMQGYFTRSAVPAQTITFDGPPNDATSYTSPSITKSAVFNGYAVLGNPYPSVVDWTNMTRNNIQDKIWFRTTTGTFPNGMTIDTYTPTASTNNTGAGEVTQYIPPMQSFWVQVNTDGVGSLTIHKTDRTHNWGATAQYLKSARVPKYDVFRLGIYNANNNRDEHLIVQLDSAKDELDVWDTQKIFAGNAALAQIFTVVPNSGNMVIQALKPIDTTKIIPLGIRINTKGTYTFKADLSKANNVYDCTYSLEDKLLNITQDLSVNPNYAFSSDVLNDSTGNRFVLHIKNNVIPPVIPPVVTPTTPPIAGVGVPVQNGAGSVLIYANNEQLYIKNATINSDVIVYDLLGRIIFRGKILSDNEIITANFVRGYYNVNIRNKEYSKSQKVLISTY